MGQGDATVAAFLGDFDASWTTNDGTLLSQTFVDDGSLITPFGQRADGRAAVGSLYSEFFAGMLRGTTIHTQLQDVRHIDADHAFVDAEQTISSDGNVVLVVHLAALLRRAGDGWQFVESRPYAIAPAPVPDRALPSTVV